MGKNLKGKELGTGISQRKDGYYIGRFTDKFGKRQQKTFKNLTECKRWVNDEIYYDEHSDLNIPSEIDLNGWFNYWINIKSPTVRDSTIRLYKCIYDKHVRTLLGNHNLKEIKPIQCQFVLNQLAQNGYKSSMIQNVKILLNQLFGYAYKNDIILKNPCKILEADIGKPSISRKALNINEHKDFIKAIKGRKFELPYRFVLQTGLRCGELMGLKWSDIDYNENVINISRSINVQSEVGDPKSDNGFRKIPLTEEALEILKLQKQKIKEYKVIDFSNAEYIFVNKNGHITNNVTYDISLRAICKKYDLPHISMHILRHTFATRCIEAGMKPKVLQIIMGHSNLNITMDLYVHITDDEKCKEMIGVSTYLKAIGT